MNISKKGDVQAFPLQVFVVIAFALLVISFLLYIAWRIKHVS
jgi:hypothetical protein